MPVYEVEPRPVRSLEATEREETQIDVQGPESKMPNEKMCRDLFLSSQELKGVG